MVVKLILAFAIALAVCLAFGAVYLPWLRKMKAGQQILEIGPNWHKTKAGTPTMGGAMFILGLTAAVFIAGWSYLVRGELGAVYVLVFSLFYGAIGFLDDYEKLKKKQNLGLSAKAKFILQLAAAIALLFLLRLEGYLTPNLYIPFFNVSWAMPEWLYFVFAAFVIVGTVNAVNLTDGVDGLATGVTIPVFIFYTVICVAWGVQFESLAVFSIALVGGLCGFLFFNFNPAKCFMGDTGSLFLGGAVAALGFAVDLPLILIFVGIIYIAETLSVILQVSYFKATHGKRIFKMSPLHHHLELSGWNENKLVAVFSAITAAASLVGYLGVMNRF